MIVWLPGTVWVHVRRGQAGSTRAAGVGGGLRLGGTPVTLRVPKTRAKLPMGMAGVKAVPFP